MTENAHKMAWQQSNVKAQRIYPLVLALIFFSTALASAGNYNERALFIDAGFNVSSAKDVTEAFVAVSPNVSRALGFIPHFGYGPNYLFFNAPGIVRSSGIPLPTLAKEFLDSANDGQVGTHINDLTFEPSSDSGSASKSAPFAGSTDASDDVNLESVLPPTASASPAPVIGSELAPEVPEAQTWLNMITGFFILSLGLYRRRLHASIKVHAVAVQRDSAKSAQSVLS